MAPIKMKSKEEVLINQINKLTEYARKRKDTFYYEALKLIKEIAKSKEGLYKDFCEN